jgi:hypothetical protein
MTHMEVLKHDRDDSHALGIEEEVWNCHALRKPLTNDTRSFLKNLTVIQLVKKYVLWKFRH